MNVSQKTAKKISSKDFRRHMATELLLLLRSFHVLSGPSELQAASEVERQRIPDADRQTNFAPTRKTAFRT